jgi:hypothetical protein
MHKITSVTGQDLLAGAMEVLKLYCEKKGIALQDTKGFSYSEKSMSFTVKFNAVEKDRTFMTEEERRYDLCRKSSLYELPERGGMFTHGGDLFTIFGWITRAKKYPILAIAEDGSKYKFSERTVAGGKLKQMPSDIVKLKGIHGPRS